MFVDRSVYFKHNLPYVICKIWKENRRAKLVQSPIEGIVQGNLFLLNWLIDCDPNSGFKLQLRISD